MLVSFVLLLPCIANSAGKYDAHILRYQSVKYYVRSSECVGHASRPWCFARFGPLFAGDACHSAGISRGNGLHTFGKECCQSRLHVASVVQCHFISGKSISSAATAALKYHPKACLPLLFVIYTILATLTYKLQPCQGHGRRPNNIRFAAFVVGAFTSMGVVCMIIGAYDSIGIT